MIIRTSRAKSLIERSDDLQRKFRSLQNNSEENNATMSNIGPEHIRHLYKRAGNMTKRYDALKERLAGTTQKLIQTTEIAVGAVAGGIIQGHADDHGSHVMGIPTDLGAGIVLNLLGYFKAAGDKYSEHLNNFGDGLIASFVSGLGFGWGRTWRDTGKFGFHDGRLPAGGGAPALPGTTTKGELSPTEVANIVARVRAQAGAPAY